MVKSVEGTLRLVYIASALLMVTTAAGLLWLNLLNHFLKEAGKGIPLAGPLSVVLGLLVISTCVHMIRAARAELTAAPRRV
jgi:hypothetical protein